MELTALLNKLPEYAPQIYGEQENECDLQAVRLYDGEQALFESSILYLASTALLPPETQPGHFTLFCYGEGIDFSKYKDSSFTLVYLGATLSYQKLFNTLQEQLTEVQKITASMHIMSNALFSDRGLQYLVDTAARILGNPIYVIDLKYKYIAISAGIFPDNPFFCMETKSGYISDEGIRLIRHEKIDEKIRQNNGPYYFINTIVGQGVLVDAIHLQGIEVGHIMLQEAEHPFDEFDADLLHRLSRMVAMELQKDSVFTSNKGVMYSYFLIDLLKNPKNNASLVKKRLEASGFLLKEDLYILAIPAISYQSSDLRMELIIQQLRTILYGSIYVVFEGNLVFLISKEKYKGLSDYEIKHLKNFLSANHLKAGISNFFEDLQDAFRFYRQAVDSVNLGIKLNHEGSVFHYRDYYLYQMLETCNKADSEIRFLIHPGLIQLRNYDKEKETDFIYTLKEYLAHPGQPSLVAEKLHIHKNTLLYRLRKIKEITNCQFDIGEDLMSFALSFKIMEYLHML